MPENPFSDAEINDQIKAIILRLQAASLEWLDNPAGSGFDDHIVETLVDSLNVHAGAYLRKVDRKDLVTQYVDYIRGVGAKLIWNAEQRSHLSDRYSDERLRKMAENTGGFLSRKHLLTPEQREAEISNAMELFRTELREEAVKWHPWRNQMLFRIETRFEASYRHWEAEAIDRVQRESESPTPKPANPSQIGRLPEETLGRTEAETTERWGSIEILFLSDNRVQIRKGTTTETLNYSELGFVDNRNGIPNQAWVTLRALAEKGGIIRGAASTNGAWPKVERRIQEIRKTLRNRYGITADPIPFVSGTGYQACFRIGCSPSFHT